MPGKEFNVREMLRPVVFIPEAKRLNVLLKDFRANRNHIAIVVDEYGTVAGLVTIEDVLEQIVGDIEDEHDFDEAEDNIVQDPTGYYRIKAITKLPISMNGLERNSVTRTTTRSAAWCCTNSAGCPNGEKS